MTRTILLVTDDDLLRRALGRLLAAQRYRVIAAKTPIEAMGYIVLSPPDLVITEVSMPLMSGFEMVGRIRELRAGTKVIYLSVRPCSVPDERDPLLVMPIAATTLRDLVDAAINTRADRSRRPP